MFIVLCFAEMISANENKMVTPVNQKNDSLNNAMDSICQNLGEITVVGHKPTFIAKLDKKVFNVGQDITSTAGSAADVLQNVPSVDVDMDGNVSLRGSDKVTILINGKPSAMMNSKTRADALQHLSAGNIECIEVYTNPSAEYKPDGTGGIINIIMKKDARNGLNGTLTVNAGSHDRFNSGININYGLGPVNLYGGYTFRRDRYDRVTKDERSSSDSFINQNTTGTGRPTSNSYKLGAGITITKNDVIDIDGNYSHRRFFRNEDVTSETKDSLYQLTNHYQRHRDALATEDMWDVNTTYTHSYGKDNEWDINYSHSYQNEDEMNHYTTYKGENMAKENEHVWNGIYINNAKLHWQHNVSENCKLNAGYELETLKDEQNYHDWDWNGTEFLVNKDNTNDFTDYRTLHSIYVTVETKLGQWNFLAGLRGENANIKNKLFTLDSISRQNYTNIYPTLHISKKINEQNEMQLGYSLRVNRPDGEDMNPFTEHINPLSLNAGNPNLKPEKIHSLEAGWLWHGNTGLQLMTTLYYRYYTNKITEVSHYIDNGVLLTTKENLNYSQDAGIEFIGSGEIGKWVTINCNLNGYYNQIDAKKLGFGKKKDTFSWSALMNANFNPFKHYMIQLNMRYRSKTLVPQGTRDADFRVDMGMKYDIPKTSISLLSSVTDMFDTYRKSYTLNTEELHQRVTKRRNPRIIYIGIAYNFGAKTKKQNSEVKYDENF